LANYFFLFATLWNKVPHVQAKLCLAIYTSKEPMFFDATESFAF